MSSLKPKRYKMWVEEQKNPLPPEILRLLPKLVLELALLEDVTGQWASEVEGDGYIAELASRLREPVARELLAAGIAVTQEELTRICHLSASETFIIRRLNEARIDGEVLVEDFNHLPLYRTYRDYFEQSSDVVAKAFGIAINAAFDRATRRDANKNSRRQP
jgi:hypothetical protein